MGVFDQYLPHMPKELRKALQDSIFDSGVAPAYLSWKMTLENDIVTVTSSRNLPQLRLLMSDGGLGALTLPATFRLNLSEANGGLDTGASAANQFYYVYAVRSKEPEGGLEVRGSLNAPAVGPVGGFTANRFLGAVLTDSSKKIVPFLHDGNSFIYHSQRSVSVDFKKTKEVIDLKSYVPETASRIMMMCGLVVSESGAAVARFYVKGSSKSFDYLEVSAGEVSEEKTIALPLTSDIEMEVQGEVPSRVSASSIGLRVQVTGWMDGALA